MRARATNGQSASSRPASLRLTVSIYLVGDWIHQPRQSRQDIVDQFCDNLPRQAALRKNVGQMHTGIGEGNLGRKEMNAIRVGLQDSEYTVTQHRTDQDVGIQHERFSHEHGVIGRRSQPRLR